MRDIDTTIEKLKDEVISMCRRKGWGINGIQNPQHVSMAMIVETMELLEHFASLAPSDEAGLLNGDMPEKCIDIAEEMSDVLMYSLQLMYTLNVDVSKELHDGFSDSRTTLSELLVCAGKADCGLAAQAMQIAVKSRFVLETFQWLNDADVLMLIEGKKSSVNKEAGIAFAGMFKEILILAHMLRIDISASIARKIAIVDKRVYPDDDPVR